MFRVTHATLETFDYIQVIRTCLVAEEIDTWRRLKLLMDFSAHVVIAPISLSLRRKTNWLRIQIIWSSRHVRTEQT